MLPRIVELGFTYYAQFVPVGCRRTRHGLFRDTGVGEIRTITPDEAPVAFRITKPSTDLSWGARRSRGDELWKTAGWSASVRELLYYDSAIWWPMFHHWHDRSEADISVDACLELIRTYSSFWEHLNINEVDDADLNFRQTVYENRARKLTDAQRMLFENLLFCGDKAYVRGGPPVYVADRLYRKNTWAIDVIRTPPDRGGDFARPSSQLSVLYPASRWNECLSSGRFWLADEFEAAAAAAHPKQYVIPQIEVLRHDLIDPSRANIRLDAFYRRLYEEFEHVPNCPFDDDKQVWFSRFERLSGNGIDNNVLSRQRLDLLREYIAARSAVYWSYEMYRLEGSFNEFARSERLNPSWPTGLDEDEEFCLEQALADVDFLLK